VPRNESLIDLGVETWSSVRTLGHSYGSMYLDVEVLDGVLYPEAHDNEFQKQTIVLKYGNSKARLDNGTMGRYVLMSYERRVT
jgi:hypothetical protein